MQKRHLSTLRKENVDGSFCSCTLKNIDSTFLCALLFYLWLRVLRSSMYSRMKLLSSWARFYYERKYGQKRRRDERTASKKSSRCYLLVCVVGGHFWDLTNTHISQSLTIAHKRLPLIVSLYQTSDKLAFATNPFDRQRVTRCKQRLFAKFEPFEIDKHQTNIHREWEKLANPAIRLETN